MVYFGIVWSTSMQNFKLLASKMTELWLFKNFDLRGLKILTSEVEVKIEARYIQGLSRSTTMQNLEVLAQKWPSQSYFYQVAKFVPEKEKKEEEKHNSIVQISPKLKKM